MERIDVKEPGKTDEPEPILIRKLDKIETTSASAQTN
jgi:hypothetical protein